MEDLPEESLSRLRRVTKLLGTQRTLPAKLEAVVALVEQTIPGCDAAGIVLLIEGKPTTAAVSDHLAVEIDLVQYQSGEGPCLEAMTSGDVIRIEVVESDTRFPRFAPGALHHDIESVLSIPLLARDRVVGALNLYGRAGNAFDRSTEEAVRPMAAYAAEAISTSPLYASALDMVEGLLETLESRALINQAAGVLMSGEHLTSEEALDRLRELALASGKSMRAVSQLVLEERPRLPSPVSEEQLTLPEDA